MADELLDLVDKNDKVIGTVWKNQAHGNPKLIHREVGMVIFNDKGEVLLQQRSLNKINLPGVWTISVAGHVGAGEEPGMAVSRELFEEVGLKVDPVFYKKTFREHVSKGKVSEARFYWIYYGTLKGRPSIKFDANEIANTRWVSLNSLIDFSKTENYPLQNTSHEFITEIAKKLKII